MKDVRIELGRLITTGLGRRSLIQVYESLKQLLWAQYHERLSWDSFSSWCLGKSFPANERRQNALADEVGGANGDAIRALPAPPFRGFRRAKMEAKPDVTMRRTVRSFPIVKREHGDQLVSQAQVTCSICHRQHHHFRRGPVESEQYFRSKGWEIGSAAAKAPVDLCPQCVEARRSRKVVQMSEHKKDPEKPAVPATAPLEMTKEDGRLISRIIEEHWDANLNCYHHGWSDQKLADDVGKAVEWVRTIRDRDFGGVGDDPDVHIFLEKVMALDNETTAEERRLDELSSSTTATASLLDAVRKQMVDVTNQQNKTDRVIAEQKDRHAKMKIEVRRLVELAEKIGGPFGERKAG